MTSVLLISAIVIFLVINLAYWRQTITKNATSIDAIWALGIGIQTIVLGYKSDGDELRRIVICSLVGLWAVRLAGHLYFTRVVTGIEDGRYTRFRREFSPLGFYGLYIAQAVLIFLLPLTFLGAFQNLNSFPTTLDIVSLSLWGVSILGEWIADRQLAKFKSNPSNRGKTCRNGLWKYSRHPNYFFEWLIWCAYIPLSFGSSLFFISFLGPLLLLFLLLKVSGVPPTEAQALLSRGGDYRDYQKTTSVFIPWFPRRTSI